MHLLSGISITCFCASYALALALELSRLLFRSGVRGALMLACGAAGLVAQSLYLGYRAATASPSSFDWYLVAAWILVAIYLYLTFYLPRTPIGLLILPLVLGLIGLAALHVDDRPVALDEASHGWGLLHGALWLGGTVAVLVGFVTGALYLLADYRLKRHLSAWQRFQLPSLEWLEKANSRSIVLSVVLLAAGLLAAVLLNLVNARRNIDEVPWADPVVWTSGLLVAWVLTVAGFNLIYRPSRQGRKVAYLTVASFVFLLVVLGIKLALPTMHGPSLDVGPPGQLRSGTAAGDPA